MSPHLGPLPGIALRGWARQLPGVPLDGASALERLGAPGSAEAVERSRSWGVETRHWLGPDGSPTELAASAARAALARAGWPAESLDLVLVATSTPELITRSQTAQLTRALEIEVAGHDVRAGGAAGLLAWIDAALWIQAGAGRALVVAVETTSRFLSSDDPSALLYGDGAVALALERAPGSDSGLVAARTGGSHIPGRAFTVPGTLPPEPGQDYTFQRGDREYRQGLDQAWSSALQDLGPDLTQSTLLAPYPVTRERLDAVERTRGRSDAGLVAARLRLACEGCIGAAGPLSAVTQLLDEEATGTLASIAVGGGGHRASLVWRHSL